jgi:hypothetical protein
VDFVRSEAAKIRRFSGFLTDKNVRPTFCGTRHECGTFLSLPDGLRRTASIWSRFAWNFSEWVFVLVV